MKFSLPGVLAGFGGMGGVAGAVVGVTYHRPEVEESRKIDIEFEKLREEIKKFADACKDQEKEGEKTILERLEDIFKILLDSQESSANLNSKKKTLKETLGPFKEETLNDFYKKMEDFYKKLKNNKEKSAKYMEKLESKSTLSSVNKS